MIYLLFFLNEKCDQCHFKNLSINLHIEMYAPSVNLIYAYNLK